MQFSKSRLSRLGALLCIALTISGCATSDHGLVNEPARASTSSLQAAEAFLEAFISMDVERFDQFFAEDVTMFFPSGPFPPARVTGKAAVTAAFHTLFDAARSRGVTRLGITPLDLQLQDYGSFAVASFHLRGNGNVGRRSIVLRREGVHWKIVHFHASALEEARSTP